MPEKHRPAPVLWFTGHAGDAALARRLQAAARRRVVVTSGLAGLLFGLRATERPLAMVLGEPDGEAIPGGVLRAVKPLAGAVPIIYVAGADPAEELAARRTGVHYLAQRPLNIDELEAVVAALADRRLRGRVVGLP